MSSTYSESHIFVNNQKNDLILETVNRFAKSALNAEDIDNALRTAWKMIKVFKNVEEDEGEDDQNSSSSVAPPQTVAGEPKKRGRKPKAATEWEPENEDLLQAFRILKQTAESSGILGDYPAAKLQFEARGKEGKLSIDECHVMIEDFKKCSKTSYMNWVAGIEIVQAAQVQQAQVQQAQVQQAQAPQAQAPQAEPLVAHVASVTPIVDVAPPEIVYDYQNKVHKSALLTILKEFQFDLSSTEDVTRAGLINTTLNGMKFSDISPTDKGFYAVTVSIIQKNPRAQAVPVPELEPAPF